MHARRGRDQRKRRDRGAGDHYESNPKNTDFSKWDSGQSGREKLTKSKPKNKKPRIPPFLTDLADGEKYLADKKTSASPQKT